MNLAKIKLPAGWTIKPHAASQCAIIQDTTDVYVTVDFASRGFRSGISIVGPLAGPEKEPFGSGWQQRLCDEAIKHVRKVVRGLE